MWALGDVIAADGPADRAEIVGIVLLVLLGLVASMAFAALVLMGFVRVIDGAVDRIREMRGALAAVCGVSAVVLLGGAFVFQSWWPVVPGSILAVLPIIWITD